MRLDPHAPSTPQAGEVVPRSPATGCRKRSLRWLRWVERLKQWGFDQEKMMVEPGKISADFT